MFLGYLLDPATDYRMSNSSTEFIVRFKTGSYLTAILAEGDCDEVDIFTPYLRYNKMGQFFVSRGSRGKIPKEKWWGERLKCNKYNVIEPIRVDSLDTLTFDVTKPNVKIEFFGYFKGTQHK